LLKIVVNCGLCEDFIGPCLQSLRTQTWQDWQAIVTLDRRGDHTFERATEAAGGDGRIVIARNRRRLYTMENILRAIHRSRAEPDDVIVILDGDDWLITDRALERIATEHEDDDCWVTYGSWISNRRRAPGRWPAYAEGCDFRTAPWLGTAVRTWKKWLFDLVADEDLRDRRGRYFRVTEDVACMFPMLEMATTRRARHIAEPLMLYNLLSHHDPERQLRYEGGRNLFDLRRRGRYPALARRPVIESDERFLQSPTSDALQSASSSSTDVVYG
jgi:hypothetical protein